MPKIEIEASEQVFGFLSACVLVGSAISVQDAQMVIETTATLMGYSTLVNLSNDGEIHRIAEQLTSASGA